MNTNLLDKPLVRALLDENISCHEVMSSFNINTQVAFNLPAYIKGFVYVRRRGVYYIILNGKLNSTEQCKTLVHEIKYIIEDLPTTSYYIGVNCQYSEIENDNEMFNALKNIM